MKTLNKNRVARFEYSIISDYVVGIVLMGSEVKPIKSGQATIKESYCYVKNGEVFISGMNVPVDQTNSYTHEPGRLRKLLLNKTEINKINNEIQKKGLTLIPLSINETSKGLIKLKIGIGKGKKLYDKKTTIKEKDIARDTSREIKNKF